MKNTKGRSSERLRIWLTISSLSESSPQKLNLALGFKSSYPQRCAEKGRGAGSEVNHFSYSPRCPFFFHLSVSPHPFYCQIGNLRVIVGLFLFPITELWQPHLWPIPSIPHGLGPSGAHVMSYLTWLTATVPQLVFFPPISVYCHLCSSCYLITLKMLYFTPTTQIP